MQDLDLLKNLYFILKAKEYVLKSFKQKWDERRLERAVSGSLGQPSQESP